MSFLNKQVAPIIQPVTDFEGIPTPFHFAVVPAEPIS
jgi:hypothetical protein